MPHGAERGPLKGMERTCVRCSGLLWLRLFGHCKGGALSAKKGTGAAAAVGAPVRIPVCQFHSAVGKNFHFRIYHQFISSGKHVSC